MNTSTKQSVKDRDFDKFLSESVAIVMLVVSQVVEINDNDLRDGGLQKLLREISEVILTSENNIAVPTIRRLFEYGIAE